MDEKGLPRQQRRASARTSTKKRARRFAAGAAVLVAAAVAPEVAQAATFTVNSLADNTTDDGQCTLREALFNANDNLLTHDDCLVPGTPGLDIINITPSGTITQSATSFDITDSLTINGPGMAALTIQGGAPTDSMFIVNDGVDLPLLDVTFSNLTITGANATTSPGGAIQSNENLTIDTVTLSQNDAPAGGAIDIRASYYVSPSLTVRDSLLTGNNATAGSGGAIAACFCSAMTPGDITIENSELTGNTAALAGGGLYVYTAGIVTITDSSISGNDAFAAAGFVMAFLDSLTIRDTTVTGNTATTVIGGGGVGYTAGPIELDTVTVTGNGAQDNGGLLFDTVSDVTIRNSQISGNTALSGGGGGVRFIYALGLIENSTISNNSALRGGGVLAAYSGVDISLSTITGNTASVAGGNIYAYEALIELTNAIVADGTAPVNPDISLYDPVIANYSLVETPGSTTLSGANNITGVDPQLGPLQNNGGPTETRRPAAASPAVNAGDPAFTPPPSTDQRFFPRPRGIVDMGAVELQPGTFAFSSPTYTVNEDGVSVTITVNRIDPPVGPAVVDFATSGGTATSGADFVPNSGPLNFVNGQTSATFNVAITDDALVEGPETFTVTLTGPSEALGSPSSATVTIIDVEGPAPFADLSITKVVSSTPPFVTGQNVAFTITVTNAGTLATTATVNDVLPPGTTFVSATPSQGSCGGTTTVICTLGSINPSANATITLTVTLNTAGPVSNTASVVSGQPDLNQTNNSGTATISAAAATAIPTLNEWMLLALATALAAFAATKLRP